VKYLRWFLYAVLILLTTIILVMHIGGSTVRCSPEKTKTIFEEAGSSFESKYIPFENKSLRVITTGTKTGKIICFLHGAPGAWNAFETYLLDSLLQSEAQLISIDRLGYGYSDYGNVEYSIIEQSASVEAVLNQFEYDSLLLVGHSYGGPIAGYLASQNPDKLIATLMLAPVIDPDGEKLFWFNGILENGIIKRFLPGFLNVSNTEKMTHARALEEIEDDWQKIGKPIVHMHCEDDWIAPYKENVDFSKNHINPKYLSLETWDGAGHLIPFNSFDIVKGKILSLLNQGD